MTRRWLALVALAVVGFVGLSYAVSYVMRRPPVEHITQPGPLVLVGVPRLAWPDVSPSKDPALWALGKRGASGAMSTRALSAHSCSSQSWLMLSASARTSMGPVVDETHGKRTYACPGVTMPVTIDSGTYYLRWWLWRDLSLHRSVRADIGRLGSSMRQIGQCISAYRAYAGVGAADRQGVVRHYSPTADHPDLTTCPVTFIALHSYDDQYIANLEKRLPPDATLVVAGMGDDSLPERLHTVVIAGPGVPHGRLTSSATRQPGVIQLTDLSALVLARMGSKAPHLPEGRAPVVHPSSSPTAPMTKASSITKLLTIEHGFVTTFFVVYFTGIGLALLALLGVWWGRRRRGQAAGIWARTGFAVVGGMAAAMPMSTFLVNVLPWWLTDHPRWALGGLITLCSAFLTAAALLGPWRHWRRGPMLFLAGMTVLVICLDITHGSRLQFISMIGFQPVYGGRFYGNGNMGYTILATCSLIVAATLAGKLIEQHYRLLAALTVLLIGAFVVLIDGYPSWGADGGGPAALIPAFAYLTLNAAGVNLTWKRIAVIGSATVVVVGGLAVLDYLRGPRHRTHLGDFVSQVRNHGNFDGILRIWKLNWEMLTSSPGTMLVPFLLLYAIIVLVRPQLRIAAPVRPLLERVTFLGHGLAAVTVCWLLGFLSNDSGTAIPPGGMMVAVPLLMVLGACLSWPREARTPAPEPPRPGEAAYTGF